MNPIVRSLLVVSDSDDLDLVVVKSVDQGEGVPLGKRVTVRVRLATGVPPGMPEHGIDGIGKLEEKTTSCERATLGIPIAGTLRVEERLDVPARITRSH